MKRKKTKSRLSSNTEINSDQKPLIRLEPISCPLCDHPSFDIVYEGIASADDCFVNSDESYYPTASKGRLVNQVVRCKGCQFVYTNPREHHLDIIKKYHDYVDPIYVSEEISRRRNARRIVNYVKEFTSPPGRWLDVGCSVGFFLDEVRKAGWDVSGIEPSRWASEFAREQLKLDVCTGPVEDLGGYPDNYYDVVSMVVVLAHLIQPVKVISEVRRILRDDGILFIQTPDFGCLMSRLMKSNWKTIKWQMLYFFNLSSLGYLLSKEEFHIVSRRKRGLGKEYSMSYILLHLIEKENFLMKAHGLLTRLGVKNLNVYLNLYEYLNLIAAKNHNQWVRNSGT